METTTKRYAKAMEICVNNGGKLYDDDILVMTFPPNSIHSEDSTLLQLLGWALGKHNCYTYKGYRAGA